MVHPVEAAKILSSFISDEETLIAALLHDVPEDTQTTLEEIEDMFGTPVAFLVDGITKLSKVHYQNNMEQRQVESLKKMLLHTARDPRVILIKLADRLHNMRTLEFVNKPEKRKRIARETLEIYVPMANLLGIQGIKSEMEDICFKHLYPEEYNQFYEAILSSEKRTHPILEKTIKLLESEFRKHDLHISLLHRKKTLYSIFQKLHSEKKDVSDIYDVITLRILVNEVDDCYKTLGVIHGLFKPKTGRFKDYIALPKVNEYRSLHTTVFGINGVLTEFQIRTHDMHRQAEIGIASLMKNHDKNNSEWKQRQFWVDEFLAAQAQEKNGQDFLHELKEDILEDRIFIFTPRGDSIYLPKGSTGIDFAYAVRTDIGNCAVRLDVNGEEKNLTSVLHNGDTVSILTSPHAHPQYEWLSFSKTNLAKMQIREFFKKESRKNKITKGRTILQKAFDRAGLDSVDEIHFSKLQKSLAQITHIDFKNPEDLFVSITEGCIDPLEVIGCLFPDGHLKNIRRTSLFSSFLSHIKRKKNTQLVELRICGRDRSGLLKDIVSVLGQFSINILKVKGWNKTFRLNQGVVLVSL
ncbi:MAG: RelA/SpoT family protein, partial [Bacteroidota bacterium]